jgi:hypothetical protein
VHQVLGRRRFSGAMIFGVARDVIILLDGRQLSKAR